MPRRHPTSPHRGWSRRRRCVAGALLAGLILLVPAVDAQETPDTALAPEGIDVAVSPTLADPLGRTLWMAATLERVLSERDYPAALSLALLEASLGEVDLEDADEETARRLAALETVSSILTGPRGNPLARCRGMADPVEGTLCSMETLAPLLPADLSRALTDQGSRLLTMYLRPGEIPPPGVANLPTLTSEGGYGLRYGPLQDFAESALEGVLGRGSDTPLLTALGGLGTRPDEEVEGGGPPSWEGAVLSVLATVSGVPITDDAGEALASAPGLGELLRVHPSFARIEEHLAGGFEAARLVEAPILETRALLEDYRSFLRTLDLPSEKWIEGMAEELQSPGDLLRTGLEREVLDPARDWASQRSFAFFASRTALLAGVEGDVVERIQALGSVAADLRLETRAFRTNLSELGQQAALAALTGNVFPLTASVAAFLQLSPGAMGPGAAEELRELRTLVESMGEEMVRGFDGIDARLDEVMGSLDVGFARMERVMASGQREILAELGGVRQDLLQLGGRIDRLEANLTTYLEAGFDRVHARTLIRCLEHRDRHLPPFDEMEFAVFSECLAEFRARGARDAADALLTDRTTPVDDLSLMAALDDSGPENLARRLPLLARAAEQRFGYGGLGGGRGGANPVEWSVAAQAYLTMLAEWPDHAARVAPGDLRAVLSTGVEVQRILDAIRADPRTGTPGGILLPVLDAYQEAATELFEEAEVLARRHEQAHLRRVDPASFLTRLEPEEAGRPELPLPSWVAGTVPAELRTAAVLALEEPTFVYRTVQTDSITRENRRRRFLFFGRRHDRVTHTRTRIDVELRVRQGEVMARAWTQGPMVLTRLEEMAGDTTSDRVNTVHQVVPDPIQRFLAETFPTLATERWAWRVTPPDPMLLTRLEEEIEAELRRFESLSLNRIFVRVCRGTAGVEDTELSAADRGSALRIQAALERMTTLRTLLDAYLRLGLPEVLEAEPRIAAALEGEDGLLDRPALCGVLDAGESPLRVVWLEEEPRARARELRSALLEALSDPEVRKRSPSTVDATIQQLRAALRVQELRARSAS
jgi:hypothetical protein